MALTASLSFYFFYGKGGAGVTGASGSIAVTIKMLTRSSSPTITTVTTSGGITVGSVTEIDGTNAPGGYVVGVSGLDPAADYFGAAHYTGTSTDVDAVDVDALQSEFSASINAGVLPQFATGNPGAVITSGTGTAQLSTTSGAVTVGTNNDKTGYALTQSFPVNFSAMLISSAGNVGMDWANVSNQNAAVTLDNTDIANVGTIINDVNGSVNGNINGNVNGDVGGKVLGGGTSSIINIGAWATGVSGVTLSTLTQTQVSGYAGPILTDNITGLVSANATEIGGNSTVVVTTIGAVIGTPTVGSTASAVATVQSTVNTINASVAGIISGSNAVVATTASIEAGLTAQGYTTGLATGIGTTNTSIAGIIAGSNPVTVGTNDDKMGYALTSAYDAAKTAAQASTALSTVQWTNALATGIGMTNTTVATNLDARVSTAVSQTTAASIGAAVWNALTSGITTAGSIGVRLLNFVTTLVYSTAPTAAQNATALLTDTTAGDFAVNGSPGKILVTQVGGTFTTQSSSVLTVSALQNAPSGGGGGGSSLLTGTAQAGSATTITLANTTPTVSLVGQQIQLKSGTGAGQVRTVGIYDTATFVLTPTVAWDAGQAPDDTTVYVLLGINSGNVVDVTITDVPVTITPA